MVRCYVMEKVPFNNLVLVVSIKYVCMYVCMYVFYKYVLPDLRNPFY